MRNQVASSQKKRRVLVVDDHLSMAEMVADGLVERGYDALPIASSSEAAKRISEETFDALITDLRMPGVDGLELLALSRKVNPERPVIVMTAYSAVETAIESIRQGAYHYMTKPFKVDELALFLERALGEASLRRETATLKRTLKERFALSNIIGRHGSMEEVCDLISRVADASAPVLILGETGTGKGLVARAIHAQSVRSSALFVSVNCASIPENLLESEIFGHVKGAFTGATSNRSGLLEEASGGTLFLDEIGEMSPALQAKLLHVLESGTVRAVGSNNERTIDTRILAATHRDLHERVAAGAFREDLMYRLDVGTIELPPLRHRREDIPDLVEYFLARAKERSPRSAVERFSQDAFARLLEHVWPGNVRELEHVVERAVLLGKRVEILASDLPASVGARRADAAMTFKGAILPMRELQHRYATWVYEELNARKVATAEKLGVDIKTLGKWLRESESDTVKS